MATGTKREKVVRPEYVYVLELSEDEVQAIHGMTGLLAGDVGIGARAHVSAVRNAIQSMGIHNSAGDVGIYGSLSTDSTRKYYRY